VQYWLEV